jgi:hypothetical protein
MVIPVKGKGIPHGDSGSRRILKIKYINLFIMA